MRERDWPNDIIALAARLWTSGVDRNEIVRQLQAPAQKIGKAVNLHTLNGFAIRRGWGKHPTSKQKKGRLPKQRFAATVVPNVGLQRRCSMCPAIFVTQWLDETECENHRPRQQA